MSRSGSQSRTGLGSSRPINVSSPVKPENKAKLEVQNLRQLLQDRMVELSNLESEWNTKKTNCSNQCEERVSELRDIAMEFQAASNSEKTKHLAILAQIRSDHQASILDIQAQIEDSLASERDDGIDDLEQEAAELKEEISRIDSAPLATEDVELADDDAEERIRGLEDGIEEKQQVHEEIMRKRDDDSRSATSMIEQLIARNREAERVHDEQISELIATLEKLDKGQVEHAQELELEINEERKQISGAMRSSNAKVSMLQRNVAKRQGEYNRSIRELHDKADQLRATLEVLTTRQKQQMKEAVATAKKFADEKKRFVSMHRELEMLNAELVRETVEHETLMKELNKMDSFVLSQMNASSGSKSSAGPGGSFRSSKL